MNPHARHETLTGVVVVAISAVLAFAVIPAGIVLPSGTDIRSLSPDYWPRIVVGMAAAAGICLAASGWRRRHDADGEQAAPQGGAERWRAIMRILVAFASLFACYFLIPIAGMVLPTFVLGLLLMWLGGERRWKPMLLTSALLPIVLHLFFADFANVPLPLGIFEGMF